MFTRDSNPKWLASLCLLLLVSVPSAIGALAPAPNPEPDQALQAALDLYLDGRYPEARSALEPLAQAGRSEAQYLLGVIYEKGFVGDPDPVLAQSWYLRSRQLHNRKARAAAARLAKQLNTRQVKQANHLAADDRLALDKDHGCMSFFGEPFLSHYVSLVQAHAPVEEMVEEILGYTGLEKNFDIRAANVPNAAAATQGSVRYLLYNPRFIDDINRTTGTSWAAYSVMAHEIGHHLQGHTIQPSGSRPPIELEADEFSGFVLAQMGADLDEAQAAMAQLASRSGTATHPARNDRLSAIAEGWNNATRRLGGQGPPPNRSSVRKPRGPRAPSLPPWLSGFSCKTPRGTCPLAVPEPIGSVCYCPSPYGWIPGYSRR